MGEAPEPRAPKRPVRPSVKEHSEGIKVLQSEKNGLHRRLKEIEEEIVVATKQRGIDRFKQKQLMNQAQAKFEDGVARKRVLRAERDRAYKEIDAVRAEINALKGKLPSGRRDILEAMIKKKDEAMQHSTLSSKEETALFKEVDRLKAGLKELVAMEDRAQKIADRRNELSEQIKALDAEIDSAKDERDTLKEERKKEREEQPKGGILDELYEKKSAAYLRINEINAEINLRNDEMNKKWDAFNQKDFAYKKKMEELREAEKQRKHEDWLRRQAQKRQWLIDQYQDSHQEDLGYCNQVISHLEKVVAASGGSSSGGGGESSGGVVGADPKLAAFKGCTLKMPKKQNDEAFFVGKGTKASKPRVPAATFKIPSSLTIFFLNLQVNLPTKIEEVPACIEAVKSKRAMFLEKQAKDRAAFMKKHAESEVTARREPEAAPPQEELSEDASGSQSRQEESSEPSTSTFGEEEPSTEEAEFPEAGGEATPEEESEEAGSFEEGEPSTSAPEASTSAPEAAEEPVVEDKVEASTSEDPSTSPKEVEAELSNASKDDGADN